MTVDLIDKNGIAHQRFLNVKKIKMGAYYGLYKTLTELTLIFKTGEEIEVMLTDYDRFAVIEEDEQG